MDVLANGISCYRNVKSLVGELSFDLSVRDGGEMQRLMQEE